MKLYVGNHILNLDAITFVDLHHTWETEEWTHAAEWPHKRIGNPHHVQHSGVKINFVDGKSIIVEDDLPTRSADNLRDWLLAHLPDLADLDADAPPTLSQTEAILAGLPAELRNLAQGA